MNVPAVTHPSTPLGSMFVAVALCALAGCGENPQETLVPVTGKVTWKGKPLPRAYVQFMPAGATAGGGGIAVTEADGSYKLSSVRGGEGVQAGEYKVAVSKRVMPDGSEPAEVVPTIESPAREIIPARYSDVEHTQLKKAITAGTGPVDLVLQ